MSNKPSLTNVTFPGQYSPYLKSSYGSIFYAILGVFLGIAAILYYGSQSGMIGLTGTVLYVSMVASIVVGLFIADRIQFVFNSQGGLTLYASSINSSEANKEGPEDTDGKTGSQKGSGIYASYSFWVYDKDAKSVNHRYLLSRKKHSNMDLYTTDEEGNKLPNSELMKENKINMKQPAIYLDDSNRIVYNMIDTTASSADTIKSFISIESVPKNEWTCVQIVQTIDDVSIYMNNRLDSVHTFKAISDPTLISKGTFVLFPEIQVNDTTKSVKFNGLISRLYYSNRAISPVTQTNLYEIGPVRGNAAFEILKSILNIPYVLTRSMFV